MKRFITLLFISFIVVIKIQAQNRPNIGCIDKAMKLQAEDLLLSFVKQKMSVYKDATISMNSQEPFPIEVRLEKGTLYQFIFVGRKDASKIKMELFNGEDKKIAEKVAKPIASNYNSNCIIYTFTPEKTDIYLVMLSQKTKHDNQCTSFTIMEQKKEKPDSMQHK